MFNLFNSVKQYLLTLVFLVFFRIYRFTSSFCLKNIISKRKSASQNDESIKVDFEKKKNHKNTRNRTFEKRPSSDDFKQTTGFSPDPQPFTSPTVSALTIKSSMTALSQ